MRGDKVKLKPLKAMGYIGTWRDGGLGWGIPTYFSSSDRRPNPPPERCHDGSWFYVCEITIKPILRNGKPIRRRFKAKVER